MSPNNCDVCGHDKSMCICSKTIVAQVGGDHYQAPYQHWDFVIDTGMGYLAGNATKYVSRWWKKGGIQDLQKARTYVEKIISKHKQINNYCLDCDESYLRECHRRFITSNNIPGVEEAFIAIMTTYRSISGLNHALQLLSDLETIAKGQQGSAETAVLASVAAPAGQAKQPGATTLAGQGQAPAPALPHRAAQRATGQAPGSNSATAEQISRSRTLTGLEHPFGYDGEG